MDRDPSMEIYSPVSLDVHPDALEQRTLNESFLKYRVNACWLGYPFPDLGKSCAPPQEIFPVFDV